MEASRKALIVKETGEDKKAVDPVALDVRRISRVTDFFVVLGGNTETQVKAIADAVEERMGQLDTSFARKEGYSEGRWILMDYGDVVVHVMHQDERKYYDLERLWGDAARL